MFGGDYCRGNSPAGAWNLFPMLHLSCFISVHVTSSDVSTLELFCAFSACREATELQREATALETSLEEKRLSKHNLLLECKVQDLKIQLLFGSLDDISEVEVLKVIIEDRYHGGTLTHECKDPFSFLTGLFLLHNNVQTNTLHLCDQFPFVQKKDLFLFL